MEPVTIVSGLPRSGTSMVMQMLEAGGMPIFQDRFREPDPDNPQGYYEHEKVKDLAIDSSWLSKAQGQAIKIISYLLPNLPPQLPYKIIFVKRQLVEVLASQKKMLERNGLKHTSVSDELMEAKFSIHLRKVYKFLQNNKLPTLYLQHSDIIQHPTSQAEKINMFIGGCLETDKMSTIVDRTLYRQKG